MSESGDKHEKTPTHVNYVELVITENPTSENREKGCDKSNEKLNDYQLHKESDSEFSEGPSTTSILSNGNKTAKKSRNRSVSFNPADEKTVKKFIEGDVIVDKQNPFKNSEVIGFDCVDKAIVAKPRTTILQSTKVNSEDDFVTTEDVLRESKYVTTYIKNPDKVFKYDPTVIARITLEDLKEIQVKKPLQRKVLTKQTQERLNELKSRYSSGKVLKGSNRENNSVDTKIPKYKRVSKSNYPELSQIKVKTGTDLDETFQLNPKEVVLNAKRFDARVKTLKIESDDELDDIEEPLTSIEDNGDENDQFSNVTADDSKKSFTNTVNSNEFQEYLNKKGLVLAPKEKLLNGIDNSIKEEDDLIETMATSLGNVDSKKSKKPSVLHRIFRPNIFSSKRKTTPKDLIPPPKSVYSNTIETSKPISNTKRVVLERQSFHGAQASNHFSANDLRKQIEQSRKSYVVDDRSSSISSALTNAEDFADNHSVDSNRQSEPISVHVKQTMISRGQIRPRERSSSELLQSKPAPEINHEMLPRQKLKEKPIPAIRRTIERQSFVERKPLLATNEDRGFRRSASLDRPEISRRTQIPIKTSTPQSRVLKKEATNNRNMTVTLNKVTSPPYQDVKGKNVLQSPQVPSKLMPVPNSSVNLSTTEWNKLRELKERTDVELYMRTRVPRPPQRQQAVKQVEDIYETVPVIHERQPVTENVSRIYVPQIPINTNFVRGSPQRNTYSGENYNGRILTIPDQAIRRKLSHERPEYIQPVPYRSQSALDHIATDDQDYVDRTIRPVVMRKKEPASPLTKEEILNRVRDFCRRSINKTPTKGDLLEPNIRADASPVSYTSVTTHQPPNLSHISAPQVPKRVHSLVRENVPGSTNSPIYAHVVKRGSLQSNNSDVYYSPTRSTGTNRQQLGSDTDSVFLPSQPISPNRALLIRTESPVHSPISSVSVGRPASELYSSNPYARPPIAPHTRITVDGRSTPLILMEPRLNPSPVYSNTSLQPQHRVYSATRSLVVSMQSPQRAGTLSRINDTSYRPGSAMSAFHSRQVPQDQYSSRRMMHSYESESGSEAGEIQRIMRIREEDWQNEKSGRNQSSEQGSDDRRRGNRREDPRRHTLGSDMLQYTGQGQPQQRAMDLEAPPIRGYTPINQGPLFDDDPGIMSEVETASTGFRRGGKQRSSLPVVRTPSKTLERPLGLVFLQYRSETKRALLPNEITSIDTVRALFVRSFPRQLTMAYLEGPNVKIYIHDASKDMFYELEDVRSHLREIRDRSVLRLFESNEVAAPQVLPGGPGVPQPLPQTTGGHWDQDQSYFSEPEFDSEYQHQHIHKSKGSKPAPYYVAATQTLPRSMYTDRNKNSIADGYTSSPERGTRGGYEEPYYSQYGTRGSTVTPIIDEEQRCDGNLTDDQYSLYGMKVSGRIPRTSNQLYDPTRPEDLHRIRVEHMERQLANLTGLVQKALNQNPQLATPSGTLNSNYLGIPGQCRGERDRLKPPPPPKPIALASTHPNYRPDIALAPEVYNHLRGLQKKAKDLRMEVRTLRRLSQAQAVAVREDIKDTFMRIRATLLASSGSYWGQGDQEKVRLSREEELYKQEVIRLEKDLSDLETSVEGLRGEVINRRTRVNMAAVEDMALVLSRASKTVAELKMKFPGLQQGLRNILANEMDKVVREEKFLKDEPDRLESALRRCKKLTGTLVTLKRLASVQEQRLPAVEPINEDPPRSSEISSTNKPIPSPRLGTVTIGSGIAPENALDALLDELQTFAKPQTQLEVRPDDSTSDDSSQTPHTTITTQHSQSNLFPAMDGNMLQVNAAGNNIVNKAFSATGSLRRLHSYPSGSDTDTSPPQPTRPIGKPPVPERNADLLSKVGCKRIPPPPPPRTSSRSPLASPTSPNVPKRLPSVCESELMGNGSGSGQDGSGNSSGNESGNDHVQRQLALEMRHQELLKKQKMLQEQYARLQQMSKNSIALPPADVLQLKKTGSESNLPQKMGLNMSTTGSMKNLNAEIMLFEKNEMNFTMTGNTSADNNNSNSINASVGQATSTTNKVYETDIL